MKLRVFLSILLLAVGTACAGAPTDEPPPATTDAADAFVEEAEARLLDMSRGQAHADWLAATYINIDSQRVAAEYQERITAAAVELAAEAARFDGLDLSYDTERKLKALKLALPVPAPADPELIAELAEKSGQLTATYGSHSWCDEDGECLQEPQMVSVMANSRDPEELLEVWKGWRTMGPGMRDDYVRVMEIANQGAQELGFDDLGAMWRSGYDLEPDAFAAEAERLMNQVRPLYESLQCHVRGRLQEFYGTRVLPEGEKTIPAHLLGNMWAQSWSNVYDLVGPEQGGPGYDLTRRLQRSGMNALDMVRTGEDFFTSLGFEPLPATFWERSQFTKPRDREVVCHASAWDFTDGEDYRIKMCIEPTADMFDTIHHELGHNFYQRAYNQQPFLYQTGANPGFHEAVGDAIALSITPEYLREIGLIEQVPDASGDVGLLLNMALDRVAALPWTYLVDQWRWQIAAGETTAETLNDSWWELRERYQGVSSPIDPAADAFDPGAKYHVPAMVEYTRYFMARILQFQFHRSLCEIAGNEAPLHRCSIFGSEEAGAALNDMLEMGASRPWPEALEALTGSPEMDATAILDYFAPLQAWLDEQNANRECGW